MQLRISPGGKMRISVRSRPELPPSSETATIADKAFSQNGWVVSAPTKAFKPDKSVESPVPPPIETIFNPAVLWLDVGISITIEPYKSWN
jgi:hypothetical protein